MIKKSIQKKIKRICSICGKRMEVLLYNNKTYQGGHYFFKLPKKLEYWECEKCYQNK